MISETIDLLGTRAIDKVTDFEGVITSVSFDLYGCVQCVVTPPKKTDGELADSRWFDVNRLNVVNDGRVMPVPDFEKVATKPADYAHGPAEKPSR